MAPPRGQSSLRERDMQPDDLPLIVLTRRDTPAVCSRAQPGTDGGNGFLRRAVAGNVSRPMTMKHAAMRWCPQGRMPPSYPIRCPFGQGFLGSPNPREVLPTADSKPAALNSNARRAGLDQIPRIALTVFDIVELPRPPGGVLVMHRDQNLRSHQGSVAFCRIGVVLVRRRSACRRIDR
jgi:hypothetical protein